jgi:hypothetical protein
VTDIMQKSKSYWARPEGKTGMIIMALAGGTVIYGWGKILPFLVDMMANTLKLGLLTAGVILFGMVAFSPRTHLLFRLLTRWITGVIIELDPIGILKDRVLQLTKRLETFGEQMTGLRSSIRTLSDNKEKNLAALQQLKAVAARAKDMADGRAGIDEMVRQRGQTELRVTVNEIARVEGANKKYEQLLLVLDRVYKQLSKLSIYLEGYIKDAQNEARQQEIQRKAVGQAHNAVSTAMKVLRGNATESDIYNQTLEFLADDASRKLGEIDEGLRWAEEFMTKVDLQSGGISDDALLSLEQFEQKMLPPASPMLNQMSTNQTIDAQYTEVFKKKGN